MGIHNFAIDLIEESGVAANWDGSNGFTDGEQLLGTPPEKDLGFPYVSVFGSAIDAQMWAYSWHAYLVSKKTYAPYIDRGKPAPTHNEWANYLKWAAHQCNANILQFRADSLDIANEGNIEVAVTENRQRKNLYYHGVVLTGPGEPLRIHDSKHPWTEHIIDGRTFWKRLPVFDGLTNARIAIIGGGETAAAIVVALLRHSPTCSIDLINRHGTVYTRGESFHENRLYTSPATWCQLDEIDKEDFIRRTDRGVFSVAAKHAIDRAEKVSVLTGNVIDLQPHGRCVTLRLKRLSRELSYTYDYVIVAIGFDFASLLELLPAHVRPVEHIRSIRRHVDYHLRIALRITSPGDQALPPPTVCNIHYPAVAMLSQGPGFANLSCLGTLSDRILSAYLPDEKKNEWLCHSEELRQQQEA